VTGILDWLHRIPAPIVQVWLTISAAAIGYVIGSVNPAAIIARVRGTDLRLVGSGNPGATNAARAFGWRTGILVGALDVVKGYLPVFAFAYFGAHVPALVAGVFAVLGHISSPFLRGRGGKGVATSLGAVLALQPWCAMPVLVVFALGMLATRRVGLASVTAALFLAPAMFALGGGLLDIVFAAVLTAIVVLRHWRNIREVAAIPH